MKQPKIVLTRLANSAYKVEINGFNVPELVNAMVDFGAPDGIPQIMLTLNAEDLEIRDERKKDA